MQENKTAAVEVNAAEQKLLEIMKNLEYGQLTITVKCGVPVHVDEIRKTIPLPSVK